MSNFFNTFSYFELERDGKIINVGIERITYLKSMMGFGEKAKMKIDVKRW